MDVSVSGHEAEAYVAHAVPTLAHKTEHHVVASTAVAEEIEHHTATIPAIPANLPTAHFDGLFEEGEVYPQAEEDDHLTALENKAHAQKVLLSSDAMRYFVKRVGTHSEQDEVLATVLEKARISFPSEEGWVVLTLERMEQLVDEVLHAKGNRSQEVQEENVSLEESVSFVPMVASSLAEAIVTKNIVAAYQLIANRPMVALADAASDIDAVYRGRKGDVVKVSDVLEAYTRELSTDTLESLTLALTSALDGKYHTEEEAVKMAILKAVQVLK